MLATSQAEHIDRRAAECSACRADLSGYDLPSRVKHIFACRTQLVLQQRAVAAQQVAVAAQQEPMVALSERVALVARRVERVALVALLARRVERVEWVEHAARAATMLASHVRHMPER